MIFETSNEIKGLFKFFRKHISFVGFEVEDFYHFLTVNVIDDKPLTLENLVNSIINDSQSGNRSIPNVPEKRKRALQSIEKDWDGITSLYKKYEHNIPSDMHITDLIINFCHIALSKETLKFARSYSKHKLKSGSFNTTFGRDEDVRCLQIMLKEHKKVIVSGEPGIGKSRFVKYYLMKEKITNYYYIDLDELYDIKYTLNHIQFVDSYGNTFWGGVEELQSQNLSSATLIIDNMYYFPDKSLRYLELLSKMHMDIIVIMLSPLKTESFQVYELPKLSEEDLPIIFEANSGFAFPNEELREQLFKETGHNTLLVSLTARLCNAKSELLSKKSTTMILQDALEYMKYPDAHNHPDAKVTFKFDYTGYRGKVNAISHMKLEYLKSFKFSQPEQYDYLKWLSCFGSAWLPIDFVARIIPDYHKKCLDLLYNMGFIFLTEDALQLSPLVSRAAYAIGIPKPARKEFDVIVKNLIQFLKDYDESLSIPYLSDVLLIFIETLYEKIDAKNNPNQYTTSKKFEVWQNLIYLIREYYYQCGDYFLADRVTSLIKYPQALKNLHSPIDPQLFYLSSNVRRESLMKEISDQFDNLCSSISKTSEYSEQINIIPFLTQRLDDIILLLCITDKNILYMRDYTLFDYRYKLITAIPELMHYIVSSHMPDEIIRYYNLCYQLEVHPNPLLYDFISCLPTIKQWNNINYRIRGTAYVLFRLSLFIHGICANMKYPYPQSVPPTLFESFLIPEMDYLHEQIQKCRLIPIQTFRICFYAYISIATVQHCLLSSEMAPKRSGKEAFNAEYIKELVSRCILSKEEKDGFIAKIYEVL